MRLCLKTSCGILRGGGVREEGGDKSDPENLWRHTMRQVNIIVERHSDGYVAYPLGVAGVVVGEGDTYEEAVADVRSAIAFHAETFGPDVLVPTD